MQDNRAYRRGVSRSRCIVSTAPVRTWRLPVPLVAHSAAPMGETSGRSTPPPLPGGPPMNVPAWLWLATIGGLTAIILARPADRRPQPHAVTIGEATRWVLSTSPSPCFRRRHLVLLRRQYAGSSSPATSPSTRCPSTTSSSSSSSWRLQVPGRVPAPGAAGRHRARAGHARHLHRDRRGAIAAFSWVFYLFAAFLIFTAVNLAGRAPSTTTPSTRRTRRCARCAGCCRHRGYHGASSFVRVDGKRMVTPMLIVMLAIGSTDLLFALDSIPRSSASPRSRTWSSPPTRSR